MTSPSLTAPPADGGAQGTRAGQQPVSTAPAVTQIGTPFSGANLNAGAVKTIYGGPISGASYSINLAVVGQASPGVPFCKVSVIWKGAAGSSAPIIGLQHWFVLQTNVSPAASNTLITGSGPSEGPYVTILLTNNDTVAVSFDSQVYQSSRVRPRHDWRSASNNIAAGVGYVYGNLTFQTPVSDPANLMLGNSPQLVVNAGATQTRINGLYAGKAHLAIAQVQVPPAVPVPAVITPFAGAVTVYSPDPDFATPWQVIYPTTVMPASGILDIPDLTLPRGPVAVLFSNTGAAQGAYAYALMGQEIGS